MRPIYFSYPILLPALIISLGFNACAVEPEITINIFDAKPSTIEQGETAELTWNISGVSWAVIDQQIGEVQSIGKLAIQPKATTTYTISVKSGNKALTRNVTVAVNPPQNTKATDAPVPTLSALDTSALLSHMGKEVRVEGNVTYTGIWSPTSNQKEKWAFIFFAKDVTEAGFPGYTAIGDPLDFASYFRAIIKVEYLDRFQEIYRVWNPNTYKYEDKTRLTFKAGDYIITSGKMDAYRSAPALYITDRNQVGF